MEFLTPVFATFESLIINAFFLHLTRGINSSEIIKIFMNPGPSYFWQTDPSGTRKLLRENVRPWIVQFGTF